MDLIYIPSNHIYNPDFFYIYQGLSILVSQQQNQVGHYCIMDIY